jgi:hypothetical protein
LPTSPNAANSFIKQSSEKTQRLLKIAKDLLDWAIEQRLEFLARMLSSEWRYSAKINIFPLFLVQENKQANWHSGI